MADVEFTQGVAGQNAGDPTPGGGLSAVANLVGATVSLALLVGVGVWGYKLMVRDVSGIPVVRALEGPMRIPPDDPGGRPADHQGFAVNAVAADGSAADPADRLVLAPQPVGLSEEDTIAAELIRPEARPVPPSEPAGPAPAPSHSDEIDALVAQITGEGQAPAPIVAPDPVVLEAAAEAPAVTPVPAVATDVPGVVRSPRPLKRPAAREVPDEATPAAVQEPATALDIDPAEVPAGTRVVQLGAYESADMARSEWDRLAAQFGDYIQDKRRIVQEASSGGRTFFRLRAYGFDDLNDARRFCSALVAEGADCIPVVTR